MKPIWGFLLLLPILPSWQSSSAVQRTINPVSGMGLEERVGYENTFLSSRDLFRLGYENSFCCVSSDFTYSRLSE